MIASWSERKGETCMSAAGTRDRRICVIYEHVEGHLKDSATILDLALT